VKPSVDDQLRESRRILLEEVLPAVESDHVATAVRRVAADLRKLGTCWEAAIPFVRWEVETLQSVLQAVGAPPVRLSDDDSYAGLCRQAETLRRALSDALRRMPPRGQAPEQWRCVLDYFNERLARDPMTNRLPDTDG
jgi:hypothetical protein